MWFRAAGLTVWYCRIAPLPETRRTSPGRGLRQQKTRPVILLMKDQRPYKLMAEVPGNQIDVLART